MSPSWSYICDGQAQSLESRRLQTRHVYVLDSLFKPSTPDYSVSIIADKGPFQLDVTVAKCETPHFLPPDLISAMHRGSVRNTHNLCTPWVTMPTMAWTPSPCKFPALAQTKPLKAIWRWLVPGGISGWLCYLAGRTSVGGMFGNWFRMVRLTILVKIGIEMTAYQ